MARPARAPHASIVSAAVQPLNLPGNPARHAQSIPMTDTALQNLLDAPDAPAAAGDDLRASVQEVVRAVAKALRTHLLYEGASPALEKFLEGVRDRFAALWEKAPQATVTVEEREILWEGAQVYQSDERESLAFLLYRDGVRELTFLRGFEREEVERLVGILATVQRVRGDDVDDLLTLLWEHEWLHLRYRYVEPLGEGVQLPGGSEAPPERVEIEAERQEAAAVVSTEDFREALYFLDDTELRRLEEELRKEMRRDTWTDVLNALFDRFEDGGPLRQEQVLGILGDVLPTLLGAGKLETAAYVLGEMVGIATSGRKLPAGVMRGLRAVFDQLAEPETVAELVRIVEQSGAAASEEALGRLLQYFPPEALGPLLRAGETSGSPAVRKSVMAAAERLAASSTDHLVKLAASPEPALAGGAARLLGRLRVATAAGEVARLLRRPETALRVTAVEALQEIRSPGASGALEAALEDPEREVRVAAARALAELRYTPARAKLEAALDGKRLREAELSERIAFFEAYGALAGAEGVPLLDRILNGKSWLGRREDAEMRACAALGLGRVRDAAAERALNAAAADTDPVVRSAVGRALKAVRQ